MIHRIYRAPFGYWLLSTIVAAALLLIPLVVIGGVPGFPHFSEAVAKWQKAYATRPNQMLSLALAWAVTVIGFSCFAIRAIARLLKPQSLKGILEQVDASDVTTKRTGWVKISGIGRSLRYEESVFNLLENQRVSGATVDIGVGVGGRVVFVDIVKRV